MLLQFNFLKDKAMKKISIIIPCYNSANTLKRCLDSVFQQTYKNFEVIAVNDGSKDQTLEVLNEYAKQYNNLKIIDKKNNGVSSARNDAIRVATGDYIQFLDSDDNFLFDDVLERNVKLLEEKGVDVVIFNFVHPCFQTYLSSGVYDLRDKKDFKKYYQDFFYSSMPWNKLFKRNVITEMYDETMAFAEDELFNLANMKNIRKVYINNEVLHNYYCEPVVDKDNASAINKIFVNDNFWMSKETIWYKCIKNNAKRDVVFSSRFTPEEYDDLKYVRPFDFFFYDFGFMCHLNTSVDTMKKYLIEGIVKEEEFRKILKSKEKYGLALKSEKIEDLERYMDKFIEFGNSVYHLIKDNNLGLKLYLILFGIFGVCFYNITGELNDQDILAETMLNIINNSTLEANFVNDLSV